VSPALSARSADQKLVFGAPARADLLPLEIKTEVKLRAQRRGLVGLLAAAVVLAIAGVVVATVYAGGVERELEASNARTQELLLEQSKYVIASQMLAQIELDKSVLVSGTSTEIAWPEFFAEVSSTLPAEATITGFTITGTTPLLPLAAPTDALESDRLAEISLQISTSNVESVADMLDGFATVTGFADATPGTITLAEGVYDITIKMHIGAEALSNRFAAEGASE
jgi:hypothetical protein